MKFHSFAFLKSITSCNQILHFMKWKPAWFTLKVNQTDEESVHLNSYLFYTVWPRMAPVDGLNQCIIISFMCCYHRCFGLMTVISVIKLPDSYSIRLNISLSHLVSTSSYWMCLMVLWIWLIYGCCLVYENVLHITQPLFWVKFTVCNNILHQLL